MYNLTYSIFNMKGGGKYAASDTHTQTTRTHFYILTHTLDGKEVSDLTVRSF